MVVLYTVDNDVEVKVGVTVMLYVTVGVTVLVACGPQWSSISNMQE